MIEEVISIFNLGGHILISVQLMKTFLAGSEEFIYKSLQRCTITIFCL